MKLKVLYVDDEPDIREVATLSLELDPDIEVIAVESGMTGLDVAARWLPDAILLDVMMPVMDGPAMLLRLQADSATMGIPIVFVTARAQAKEIDELINLGARGVIRKPFDPMTLAADLRSRLPS